MSRRIRFALAVLALAPPAARADEGGVGVQSGETLFAQGTSVTVSWLHSRSSRLYEGARRIDDPERRARTEDWAILGASYGLREDLTLSLLVPVVSQHESFDGPGGRAREGVEGLSDASVMGKYRFYFDGGAAWEATAAAIAGVQLPTGDTGARDDAGVRLDPELQLGSGSWDPFAGAALTYEWDRFEAHGFTLYQRNAEGAHEFKHGDIATVGATLGWRPLVEKYPGAEAGVETGAVFQHAFGAYDHGVRERDSGGDLVYATLGAFYSPRTGLKANASLDVPLWQDWNGRQLGLGYRASAGLTVTF